MVKLGAHQSIAGGYTEALKRVVKIGGNCLQIFSGSPRGWNFAKAQDSEIKDFLRFKSELLVDPVYFHASYLINLADSGSIGHLSKQSLIAELELAPKIGVKGTIVHLGSYKTNDPKLNYSKLLKNISFVIEKSPKLALFIIENAGNRKIGQTLEEISRIIKDLNDNRVRLCLDTCHLFSNGYRFETENELSVFLGKLSELDLLDKLELWHVNDSRDPFNSVKDRHANIGQGSIGENEFKTLLNHSKMKNYPFIIETPGFKDEGPDKRNLDILKSYISV